MKYLATILGVVLLLGAGLALGQTSGGDFLKQGQEVYESNCADCHRTNGEGLPVKFPSLKGSAFVMGDPKPVINVLVNGRKGKLGQMPAWRDHLDDAQIAKVISYIRNAWGNKAPTIKPEDVAAVRQK